LPDWTRLDTAVAWPLVVGCCAFDLPDCQDIINCRACGNGLEKWFPRTAPFPAKDSDQRCKVVYSPSEACVKLERGVLAIITAMAEIPGGFHGMISRSQIRP